MDFQCVFWNGRTEKHQTSTARFRLAEENGQHRPFPSLACVLPHPLQNRVPRVQVLLPLPKSQVSLLRYLTFSLVCGRIWQRGAAAGPPAVCVVGACSPVGCVQARPRRQPRQVRPSIFSMLWRSHPSFPCSIASFLTRFHPPPPSPAPGTHPVSPFFGFSGCVFLFFAAFWPQNFRLGFCATCHIVFTS